jgi:alkylation response protein AidB-like acyl-CoA dehydrogenase
MTTLTTAQTAAPAAAARGPITLDTGSRAPGGGPDAVLAAARSLVPGVLAERDAIERERCLPPALARRLTEAGLFRLFVPRPHGGLEVDPLTAMGAVEVLAAADGSVGWVLGTNNVGGLLTAWLPADAGWSIFGPDPGHAAVAGALVPRGRAVPVPDGYRVSGRWPYVSGVAHSTWLTLSCVVADDAGPEGPSVVRTFFVPTADGRVVDTWDVMGLRGTGSHDVVIEDVFVPHDRAFSLGGPPRREGPLYAFPARGLGAAMLSAMCLGVARGAIDGLIAMAAEPGPGALLRERPAVHARVAEAEALVGAARGWLHGSVRETWDTVASGGEATLEQRSRLRLAATHATDSAVRALDLLYAAGGASALYARNPLERRFRDVHAAAQHFGLQPWIYEETGRLLVGLPPGPGSAQRSRSPPPWPTPTA